MTAEATVDDVAPLLSTPRVSDVSDTGATVNWSTNEPATTLLKYGLNRDKGGAIGDGRLALMHLVNLSGLKEAATYYASASGTDEAGNRTSGPDFTFTTSSLPPYLTAGSTEGSQTGNSSTVISGVCTDPSGVISVAINGAAADYRASDGYYSLTEPLQAGINIFTVTAFDSLGNSARATVTVTRLSAPDLLVTGVSGPASIKGGESVAVTSSVQASPIGGAASGFYIHLFLSADSSCTSGDTLLAARYVTGLASGAISTASTQVSVPLGLSPGSYYFCAIVDPYNTVSESIEENNTLTGNSTIYVGADLVMTGVSGPASITSGSAILVTSSVQASSTGMAAPGFYVDIFLSTTSSCATDYISLGSRYVFGLAAGETSTAGSQVTVPLGLSPGSYYFCAKADQYDTVKEGDERNNTVVGNSTTYAGADLVMTGVSGPATITGGSTILVMSSVQASSTGMAASGFYVELFLSANSSCSTGNISLGSRYVGGLAAGSTNTAGSQVLVPLGLPPGSYYFCAKADQYDTVKEGSEGNNTLAGNNTTCVGADLVMTGVSGPASIKSGSVIQLTSSVQASLAGGAAPGFYIDIFLSGSSSCSTGYISLGSRYVTGLAAGATNTAGSLVTVPLGLSPGIYYFCAKADQYDTVKEGIEGNNTLTGNSATYVGADLLVTGVSGPASITGGSAIQVTSSVQASPTAGAAPGFYVELFLSADSSCSTGYISLGSRYVTGLAAGAASTAGSRVTVPLGLSPGSYYFCAKADQYDTMKEENEGNNTLSGNMTTCTGNM